MLLRLILRAEQQEDAVDRLVVQRGEVDPAALRPIVPAIFVDLRVLHVRDGDALAEAGRAVLLALDQRGDDFVDRVVGQRAGVGERL